MALIDRDMETRFLGVSLNILVGEKTDRHALLKFSNIKSLYLGFLESFSDWYIHI